MGAIRAATQVVRFFNKNILLMFAGLVGVWRKRARRSSFNEIPARSLVVNRWWFRVSCQ